MSDCAMPGRRGTEKRQLSETVLVRLEPEEKARLVELANAEGLTPAAFVRLRLAGGAASPPRAQAIVASNLALVRELRRLGGSVRQIMMTRDHSQQGRDILNAIAAAIAHSARPVR